MAVWQTRLATSASIAMQAAAGLYSFLARPEVFPRLRGVLIAILAVWIFGSLWTGLVSFVPESDPLPPITVINPVSSVEASLDRAPADIDAIVAANLFGEPGASIDTAALAAENGSANTLSEEQASIALAGIEDGAPETRLPLLLRGVVASSEAGLGQAVIEHRKVQDLYQVGDELPVNGAVELAKVLSDRVVLENGGRYEILRLFEETELSRLAAQLPPPVEAAAATETSRGAVSVGDDASELASKYRRRLYSNPESLAEVVRISDVRRDGALYGYRLMPGRAAQEFTALGFKAGDVVTAVNGMALSNPANAVRLYQAMRTAEAATFDLERAGEVLALTVSIGSTDEGGQ
ncbi:MAG: type II secretion system protein GspC [Pseudomonadota bacterium]